MKKRSIQQESIVVNIYAPNIRAPKYKKQILTELKGKINSNEIIVGDLIPYSQQWIDIQSENQ